MSAVATGQCQQRRLLAGRCQCKAVDKALTSPDTPVRSVRRTGGRCIDGQGTCLTLDLYHPWSLDADAAIAIAKRCQKTRALPWTNARQQRRRGSAPANRSLSTPIRTASAGLQGRAYYIGCAMVASDGDASERDDWYTSHRVPNALDAAEDGRIAASVLWRASIHANW